MLHDIMLLAIGYTAGMWVTYGVICFMVGAQGRRYPENG